MVQIADNKDLERRITAALDKHRFCSFATVEGNRPKARYMALFHDGLSIYLATDRRTHKVEELQANPNVYLLFGFEGKWPSELVEVAGTCKVTKDDALRGKVWNDDLKMWFKGPDDPDYVILEVTPTRIEYTGEDRRLQVWER